MMVSDFQTVLWKEWRESILQYGGIRKWLFNMSLMVGVLGILLPLQLGVVMVESVSMLFWMWMPLLLIINAVADTIAGERERHTLETLLASRLSDRAILLGKMVVPIFQAWLIVQLSAILAVITANIASNENRLIMYPAPVVMGFILFPILAGALVAEIGIIASTHAKTVRQAYQRMVIPLLAIVMLPSILISLLPQPILSQLYSVAFAQDQVGVPLLVLFGILFLLDMVIMTALFRRFKRSRLI